MYDDLIRSIRTASRLLGKEFTEKDIPTNPNVYVELQHMSKQLWGQVKARRNQTSLLSGSQQ